MKKRSLMRIKSLIECRELFDLLSGTSSEKVRNGPANRIAVTRDAIEKGVIVWNEKEQKNGLPDLALGKQTFLFAP
jgi:hypothetical protein